MTTETKKLRDPREWCFAQKYYGLTIKQWKFAMYYVGEAGFDAHLAILMSYGNCKPHPSDDEKIPVEERNTINYLTSKQMATQNLAKVPIQECISDILQVTVMPKEEVLNRITRMARADIGDLIDIDANGRPSLNLSKAKQKGALCLVKRITYDNAGQVKSVEMHDAFSALVTMGKHHKLFDRRAEQPDDPRELARELYAELRVNYGETHSDEVLKQKVLQRFSTQGVTESDLMPDLTDQATEAVS